MKKVTEVENTDSSVLSVFFGICNTRYRRRYGYRYLNIPRYRFFIGITDPPLHAVGRWAYTCSDVVIMVHISFQISAIPIISAAFSLSSFTTRTVMPQYIVRLSVRL